jgi:hypothetical protein
MENLGGSRKEETFSVQGFAKACCRGEIGNAKLGKGEIAEERSNRRENDGRKRRDAV